LYFRAKQVLALSMGGQKGGREMLSMTKRPLTSIAAMNSVPDIKFNRFKVASCNGQLIADSSFK